MVVQDSHTEAMEWDNVHAQQDHLDRRVHQGHLDSLVLMVNQVHPVLSLTITWEKKVLYALPEKLFQIISGIEKIKTKNHTLPKNPKMG